MYVRMYDSPDQSTDQIDTLARLVNGWMSAQKGNVLVHCQAGLNRSSLVVARVMMMRGYTADEAIKKIREARSPACLCNDSFEDYLRNVR